MTVVSAAAPRPGRARRIACAPLAAAAGLAALAAGPAAHAQARQIERIDAFDRWSVFDNQSGAEPSCFAATTPSAPPKMSRAGAARGDAFLSAALFPNRGGGMEVAVTLGYPADPKRASTLSVDGKSYKLTVESDTAWLEEPSQDTAVIEAMKRGARAVVTATSTRGTRVTDQYSLSGFTNAVNRVRALCKKDSG
ncbi:MAG: invasion associated locus B family protein [Pseudomonadota bacterium]